MEERNTESNIYQKGIQERERTDSKGKKKKIIENFSKLEMRAYFKDLLKIYRTKTKEILIPRDRKVSSFRG